MKKPSFELLAWFFEQWRVLSSRRLLKYHTPGRDVSGSLRAFPEGDQQSE